MMAYEGSESALNNFVNFIYQIQPKTGTHLRKLETILMNLNWEHVFII